MSVVGRRQLAPHQRAYKYEFTLELLSFKCYFPLPCRVRFMWKRNNKGIQTKNLLEVKQPGFSQLAINQKVSSFSTIVYNMEKRLFTSKQSELIVNMLFDASPKKLGSCMIDTSAILDPHNCRNNRSELFDIPVNIITISKNATKDCRITFRLSSSFLEEVSSEKSSSGALNMSGMSGPYDAFNSGFDGKFFDKKSKMQLKQQAIPSKDNHSVSSYNTGLIRYNSITKRDKDQTSSIRKYDYGFLGAMKSNITNQYEIKSGMKSVQNRTEINDGASVNRQLIDQQNKRSKLQAQLNKNKVQNTQIKKHLNELTIENLQLKEEISRNRVENEHSNKQQMNALQIRIYQLTNQIDSLKRQLGNASQGRQQWQYQQKTYKSQLQGQIRTIQQLQSSIHQYKFKMQQLQRNQVPRRQLQNLQSENGQLRFQLDNLRRFMDDIKRQQQQKEYQMASQRYRQKQEMTSHLQQYRREIEKNRKQALSAQQLLKQIQEWKVQNTQAASMTVTAQRQAATYQNQLNKLQQQHIKCQLQLKNVRENQGSNQVQLRRRIQSLQRQNSKIVAISGQLQLTQRSLDQKQKTIVRLQMQKQQWDGKSTKLLLQHNQQQQSITQLNKKLQQTQVQLKDASQRARRSQETTQGCRQQLGQMRIQQSEWQQNRNALLRKKGQLEAQVMQLQGEISQMKTKQGDGMRNSAVSGQMDKMMRQTLQMEMEIKYNRQEMQRMKGVQQKMEEYRWKVENDKKERQQLQGQLQKTQKQLAGKNRALMIQLQKAKLMAEQLTQAQDNCQLMREELQQNRNIISNGQEQLNSMQQYIQQLVEIRQQLEAENQQIRAELTNSTIHQQQIRQWQDKVAQLTEKNAQKQANIQNLKSINAQQINQIKQLQKVSQQRHQALLLKEKQLAQLQIKCRQQQQGRTSFESQLARVTHDKKMVQKRVQMVMQQMYGMKRKFQQEKGRSVSISRNQQANRIRWLQNENQKKDKQLSKCTKEKFELEEENVRLNVEIMKLLSEKDKNTKGQGTSKSIPSK